MSNCAEKDRALAIFESLFYCMQALAFPTVSTPDFFTDAAPG
jgi:hypothetical protein